MRRVLFPLLLVAACAGMPDGDALAVALPGDELVASLTARWLEPETVPPPRVTTTELVAQGTHWRLVTPKGPVHVWIPGGYKRRRAETVIYVHGYYTNVDGAWKNHNLATQFASAGINAVFIACEAPASNSEAVKWTTLEPLLAAVEKGIAQKLPRRRLVAIGHSGAYRTLDKWLAEPLLDTVVLLDAAYGELASYRDWVLGKRGRRLIDVGDGTKAATDKLHATLPQSLILDKFPSIEEELPDEARRAKILYIRSTLGHFELVTGGEALPMLLRTLRAKRLLDVPLADLLAPEGD
jgi:hypothetical protein